MDLKILGGAAAAVLLMSAPGAFAQNASTADTSAKIAGDPAMAGSTDAGADPAMTGGMTTTDPAMSGTTSVADDDHDFPWGLLGLLGLAGLLGMKRRDDDRTRTTSTIDPTR